MLFHDGQHYSSVYMPHLRFETLFSLPDYQHLVALPVSAGCGRMGGRIGGRGREGEREGGSEPPRKTQRRPAPGPLHPLSSGPLRIRVAPASAAPQLRSVGRRAGGRARAHRRTQHEHSILLFLLHDGGFSGYFVCPPGVIRGMPGPLVRLPPSQAPPGAQDCGADAAGGQAAGRVARRAPSLPPRPAPGRRARRYALAFKYQCDEIDAMDPLYAVPFVKRARCLFHALILAHVRCGVGAATCLRSLYARPLPALPRLPSRFWPHHVCTSTHLDLGEWPPARGRGGWAACRRRPGWLAPGREGRRRRHPAPRRAVRGVQRLPPPPGPPFLASASSTVCTISVTPGSAPCAHARPASLSGFWWWTPGPAGRGPR